MDGKKIKNRTGLLSLFCLCLLIVTAFQCGDERPVVRQYITFVLPVSIVPQDSVFNIGDTIWIDVAVSDSLDEYHSKKKYKLPKFDFGQTSIGVRKLVDKSKDMSDQLSAVSDFKIHTVLGTIDFLGNTFIDIKFVYNPATERYLLKFGFVPQSIGVYCFAFLSPDHLQYGEVLNLGTNPEGVAIVPIYDHIFYPVNDGNNNFELFKQYCFDSSALNPENYQTNNYIRYGTFTFRVVE